MKKTQLTKAGYQALQNELTELRNHKLPAAIARVARAREFGDLSENSEYQSAREELDFLRDRIQELETTLATAEIIKTTNSRQQISVGCQVTLYNITTKQTVTYQIVGEMEADPLNNKISHTSPLGQALLGKKSGDKVEFQAPAGKIIYQIKKIH